MVVKSPSPAKVTKERIERDKRQYERLVRKIKHVVYSGHPSLWDWVKDTAKTVADKVKSAASKVVDFVKNEIAVSQNLNRALEHTFTYPAEDFNRESKEQLSDIKDTVDDWFDDREEEVHEAREKAEETVKKAASTIAGGVKAAASAGFGWLLDAIGGIIAGIKALIDAILGVLGDAMTNAFEAIMALPLLLISFRDDIANFFKFDYDDFAKGYKSIIEPLSK